MSMALARGTSIDTYGNPNAGDRVDELLQQWLELDAACGPSAPSSRAARALATRAGS
jgi:hypothetical protein